MSNEDKPLLTTKQVKERLNLPSVFSVYKLMREKKLPYYRFGKSTIRFDPAAVDEAMKLFEVKAAGPR